VQKGQHACIHFISDRKGDSLATAAAPSGPHPTPPPAAPPPPSLRCRRRRRRTISPPRRHRGLRVTRRHCRCVAVVFVRRRAALRCGCLRAASRGGGLRAALRGVGRLHAASRGGCLCAASRGGHLGGVVFTRRRAAVVFVRRCVGAWRSSSRARGLSSRGRCLHVPSRRGRCLRVAVGVVVGAVVGLAPGEVSACPPATARARDGATQHGSGAN
jgi:hypothetical protein